ncbi:MAG TPA: DeoR/GlpR family DNA-binding transcription regulator [Spirochaetia bacterium]|nr:DeoR/GlpR family DNA-binding transcription regulator [Spirochaetia bacterium]
MNNGDRAKETESDKPETMFAEERKIKILEVITQNETVTVAALTRQFRVSGATIRNDLRELEKAEMIIRTHGGAMTKSRAGYEPDSLHKEEQYIEERRRIAEVASGLVEDGDVIVLDTGTTTLEVAKRLKDKRQVTVVTNDLEIARVLEEFEGISTVLMGGILRKHFHCVVGFPGREMLAGFVVDKAFMGTNSFSLLHGATTPDISTAETKKAMIGIANKIILVCDSHKIGKTSFVQFAAVDDIDILVTDETRDTEIRKFEEAGIEVIRVAG